MIRNLRLIASDPGLLVASVAVLLFGTLAASMAPFLSIIAIQIFELSDSLYGGMLFAGAVMSVLGAIWLGILSDQTDARRGILLGTIALTLFANLLVWIWPNPWMFLLVHGVLVPVAGSLFGQIFALARLAVNKFDPGDRDPILATIRAIFAVPFIVVLPLWSIALDRGVSLLWLYPAVALISAALFLLFATCWPRGSGWRTEKSGQNLIQSLSEVLHPQILIRVMAAGAVNSGVAMYMIVTGLFFASVEGRDLGDVALFFGLVAGLEIPVMLSMGWLLRHMSRLRVILLGAVIHAGFMLSLPLLVSHDWVWALTLPAALGAGIILSLPIAYLQDLMGNRAGAGGALLSLQRVASEGLCAAMFASAAYLAGYGLAAIFAGISTVLGALALIWLDRGSVPKISG